MCLFCIWRLRNESDSTSLKYPNMVRSGVTLHCKNLVQNCCDSHEIFAVSEALIIYTIFWAILAYSLFTISSSGNDCDFFLAGFFYSFYIAKLLRFNFEDYFRSIRIRYVQYYTYTARLVKSCCDSHEIFAVSEALIITYQFLSNTNDCSSFSSLHFYHWCWSVSQLCSKCTDFSRDYQGVYFPDWNTLVLSQSSTLPISWYRFLSFCPQQSRANMGSFAAAALAVPTEGCGLPPM